MRSYFRNLRLIARSLGVSLLFCPLLLFSQELPRKFALSDQNSFSMILLPDLQSYSKFNINQPLVRLMNNWILNNQERLNIKMVLCTGDLVEQNSHLVPDNINGNQTSKQQWLAVSDAFSVLDNKIPYILCTGNHDYGYKAAENRMSAFPEYFSPERSDQFKKTLVGVCNNSFGKPTLENAAYEFDLPNWGKVLVFSLEFAPRDEALEWAKAFAAKDEYRKHKVFVLTHSYMKWDGTIIETEPYKISPANYGKAIWKKLIFPSPNIRLVLSGHDCRIDDFEHNVGQRIDKNMAGKGVFQMMFNAQTAGGGWHGNGGDGWLRLLEFLPDGKTIKVKTYSPFFGLSPTTEQFAWRKGAWDEFTFVLD